MHDIGAGRVRYASGTQPILFSLRARFMTIERMFLDEMTSEIRLVKEIEKYECLYNNFLPEYNRKDLADAAWYKVSKSTELKAPPTIYPYYKIIIFFVAECKEKWRNIRSSLLRSLKPSEKTKKPYYLAPYLQFILPFMKPLNGLEQKEDTYNSNNRNEVDILLCSVKSEEESLAMAETPFTEQLPIETVFNSLSQSNPSVRKRKREKLSSKSRSKSKHAELKLEDSFTSVESPKTNYESMHYFLMSLLPELATMTEEQTRMFKIKVMMLIDSIKTNYGKMKQDMQSLNESSRLQKRLINLLLKNLRNKM